MTVFNLVHISDLHFGYRPEARVSGPEIAPVPSNRRSFFNTHDHKAAQGVMREVGLYARRLQRSDDTLDGIIITGDLATIGFRIDLARALEFVRDDLLSLVREHPAPPIFLMPGNHDRYTRYGIAGGTEFEWVFSNWWPSSRAEPGGRRNCHHRIFSKTDGGREQYLGVVGYDFSPTLAARPGHEPIEYVKNLGRGYVEEGHVRELTQRTEELREVFRERGGICIVWAIHFPPWNHEYASSRLDKYDDVLKAAIKCNIRLILSGHIHDPRPWMQFDKDREIWCAGSACQFGEVLGNWFHTLAIGVEGEELERAQRTNFRRVEDTVEFRGAIRAQSLGEPRWNPLWLPL